VLPAAGRQLKLKRFLNRVQWEVGSPGPLPPTPLAHGLTEAAADRGAESSRLEIFVTARQTPNPAPSWLHGI
jgi:hypothetical protein